MAQNVTIDSLETGSTDKCIIGSNTLLTDSYFTKSDILRGSYFCGDANLKERNINDSPNSMLFNNIIPNNLKLLDDEIFYNDTIWRSYACYKLN